MITKKQLEKEIEYIENFPEEKDQTLGDFECNNCSVELNISERDKGNTCINCKKATLTQTNEIIKLIDSQELKDCFKKLCKDFPIKYQWKLGKIYAKFRKELLNKLKGNEDGK